GSHMVLRRGVGRGDGAAAARQLLAVDRVDVEASIEGDEADGHGRLREAVARDEGGPPEAVGREGLGESGEDVRAYHVAADARHAPGGEIECRRSAAGRAPGAQVIAEGWAEGEG